MPTQTEDVEPVDGGLENLTDVAVEESVVEKSQDAGGGKVWLVSKAVSLHWTCAESPGGPLSPGPEGSTGPRPVC